MNAIVVCDPYTSPFYLFRSLDDDEMVAGLIPWPATISLFSCKIRN